ncbi:putative nepenthesin [Dioscorea sansibarensis]
MATSYASFLASLLIFLSVLWNFNACNASSQGGLGFSMNLIHRDSPRSPYYQPSLSSKDRVKAMFDRSLSRARYLSSIISSGRDRSSHDDISNSSPSSSSWGSPAPPSNNVQSKVIPGNGDYLMELEIGTPPVKIMATADTGSDLTWVQCQPCVQCYNQKDPIFDPRKSSTFNGSVPCGDDICHALPSFTCDNQNKCQYDYEYGDGSATYGTLSKDTFTFSSSDSNKLGSASSSSSSIPGIFFGCSYNSTGDYDVNEDGLVGLGGGSASLVRQLDSSIDGKFSYCLVPYNENATSTLNFGDNAVVNGPGLVTVPMVHATYDTFYTLEFKSLTVGKETVQVPIDTTQMIVDSGTTVTFIPLTVYVIVIDNLSKMVNLTQTPDPQKVFDLCYLHPAKAPAYPFPNITFNFNNNRQQQQQQDQDEVSVVLSGMQTFFHVTDDIVCLAMGFTDGMDFSVFGNVAQQNLHVGYDLHNKSISFAPANCSAL